MRSWFCRAFVMLGCCGGLGFLMTAGCFLEAPDVNGFFCTSSNDCLAPLICEGSKCRRPCFSAQDCREGNACSNGYCSLKNAPGDGGPDEACSPGAKELCDGIDNNCNGQIDEGIPCASEGEACDLAASPAISCKPGMSCESFSPVRPRVCLRLCDVRDVNSCKDTRFKCSELGDLGVCVETPCTKGACSYNFGVSHTCDSVGNQEILCRPSYAEGQVAFGKSCSPTRNEHCKSPYKCARRKGDLVGFCTALCVAGGADPCPGKVAGSKCETIEGNFMVCNPPCTSNTECPTNMTCDLTAKVCRFGQ